ncbi:predicted protein [Histoplasma capsulatum var. duboisii H88]|uniref:Predicted protein n=1 Tax=Ajellomyces capsulatus (strain H88) TaxID=544711 RepID=F0USD6_AJEC8|nr:predicted protein [Histoplasma capsulatum var. duboisii H88]
MRLEEVGEFTGNRDPKSRRAQREQTEKKAQRGRMEAWRGKDTGGSSFRRSEEFFQRQPSTEQTSKQQTARGRNRGMRSPGQGEQSSNRREISVGRWRWSCSSSRELVGVVVAVVVVVSNPSSSQPASRTSIPCHLLRIPIKVHNLPPEPRLPPSLIDGGNDFKPGCGEKSK